jgi:lipopolysaccharide transport system permease protein
MYRELNLLINCIKNFELWYTLGITKLRIRFLRTKLGPLWEIIGTLAIISIISLIWSKLWGKNLNDFLPYLFFGYVLWKTIISIIGDANMAYHEVYKNVLENVYIHPFQLSVGLVAKNFIVFFGFLICCLFISFFVGNLSFFSIIYLFYFVIFFFISSVCLSFLFGLLCLKYRDLQHSIGIILNLAFFVTPIIWEPSQLGERGQIIVDLNLIYYYIEFFRSSLIYGTVNEITFCVVTLTTLILVLFATFISKKYSRKMIFWLI